MKKFCFDLDGTIFQGESLPYIAQKNGLWEEYSLVAKNKPTNFHTKSENEFLEVDGSKSDMERDFKGRGDEVKGDLVDIATHTDGYKGCEEVERRDKAANVEVERECIHIYKQNLLKRIAVLQKIPVQKVIDTLVAFPVNEDLVEFIKTHKDKCVVITSNLDCWVGEFLSTLGCEFHTSKAKVENGHIVEMESILDKPATVRQYKDEGYQVIYIGDGLNDVEAMRIADFSIAFLASKDSYKGLEQVCNCSFYNQSDLVAKLKKLNRWI